MNRGEYLRFAEEAVDAGKISPDIYEVMIQNADVFSEEDDGEK